MTLYYVYIIYLGGRGVIVCSGVQEGYRGVLACIGVYGGQGYRKYSAVHKQIYHNLSNESIESVEINA